MSEESEDDQRKAMNEVMGQFIALAADRGLRLELEFDDQEMELESGEKVVLNGKTVVKTEK